MNTFFSRIQESSFVRFAGVGALSTVLDFAVLNLFLALSVSIYIAGALGFLTGFANGYFFNSRFVFKKASKDRAVKYFVVSIGGLLLTELILHIFHVSTGLSANVAKLIAVVIVFIWNYSLSKLWAFA